MYSMGTIKKFMALARDFDIKYSEYSPEAIMLCISTGNKKIGRVMNVSLMPIVTCHNCSQCMHLCYDIKACLQYPGTVIDARMRNTVMARDHRDGFFTRIDKAMSRRRKNKYFRWHVAGDIVDPDYFNRMVKIAIDHPDFIIWTYTKNYSVVNDYVRDHGGDRHCIPANFAIMFSEWRGMPMVNPYEFPVFTVRFKDENESKFKSDHCVSYKCPGNCDICKLSGRGCVVGESTYCDEH